MPKESDALERRKHFRADFHIPMRYRQLEKNSPEFKGGLMRDISQGGARMTIFEFLPMHLNLAAEIPLISGAKPLKGTGRIAWVKKVAYGDQHDVGIEFTGIDHEDITQINEFVSWQKTGEKR